MAPRSSTSCVLSVLRNTAEQDALEALERLSYLDEKFGEGCGAGKERARLLKRVESFLAPQPVEDTEQDLDDTTSCSNDESDEEEECDTNYNEDQDGPYIDRHGEQERVAIFGGDPSRRKQLVEKRLRPYKSLDQFGTPRDVGTQDQRKIVQMIKNRSFDVVYIWTRFGNHSSRHEIRDACRKFDTRCVEIESLSRIQKQ